MSYSFRILVAGVVIDGQDRVLMLRRSARETFMPGHWGVPAGKIDFGEKPEVAVLRELKEEAGLEATIRGIAGYSDFLSTTSDGQQLHNMQLNFLLEQPRGEVVLDDANDAAQWLAVSEMRGHGYDEFQAVIVDQALTLKRRLDQPA